MKTLFALFAVLSFVSCASMSPYGGRSPNSSTEKITSITVPVSDITSMVALEGSTNCTKTNHAARGGIKYSTYNCMHVTPFSFAVKSTSAGINKNFSGTHEVIYQGMLSKKDVSVNPGLAKFHEEESTTAETYLRDVVSGCYGPSVEVTIVESAGQETVTLKHHAYFGKARCTLTKATNKTKSAVFNSWTNIKTGATNLGEATAEHVKWLAQSADSLQQSAREKVGAGLKNLGEAIQPN